MPLVSNLLFAKRKSRLAHSRTPLVIRLAFEEREHRALRISHDRDPARPDIERPGQRLAA